MRVITWRAARVGLVAALIALALGVRTQSAHAFTVYTVTNTNDSGGGSLRQAILDANANPGADAIQFNIPGPGVQAIQPLTPLPFATDNVAIEGWTQPGYAGTPLIQLDGIKANFGFGLGFTGGGLIYGLDIVNFLFAGIIITDKQGAFTTVNANVIGADPTGTVAMGNKQGIRVLGVGTVIGDGQPGHGNVISGNGFDGIKLEGARQVTIEGNMIGTTSSGGQALGNFQNGIWVAFGSTDNTIGAPGAGRNVISGNGLYGVHVSGDTGSESNRNVIQDNLIGTDASGTFPVPNAQGGVAVGHAKFNHVGTWPADGNVISGNTGPGVTIGFDVQGNTVESNLIGVNSSGGEALGNSGPGVLIDNADSTRVGQQVSVNHPGMPNVISGNQGGGVRIQNSISTAILGNLIGTGQDGQLPIGNTGAGVSVVGGSFTFVGGGVAGQGNVISANTADGVLVQGDDATGTPASGVAVQGNLIGTDSTGFLSLGNGGNGITVLQNASGTRIGQVLGLAGANVIAHNGGAGIGVLGSTGVPIRGNQIFLNGGLGIDLDLNGVTPNDGVGDPDLGANDLQNFPVLSSVKLANGQLSIKGILQSAPNSTYALDLFTNTSCDPSGFGEGESFLKGVNVVTDALGNGVFALKVPYNGAAAPVVTATATAVSTLDTSEFAACK